MTVYQTSGIVQPLSSSSSSFSEDTENMRLQENAKMLQESLEGIFITDLLESFHEHVFKLHGDTPEQLQVALDKVINLFKRIFPDSSPLNSSIRSYQLLNSNGVSEALEKANQLYEAFKKECVSETLANLPSFFLKKHKTSAKDLSAFREIVSRVTETFKTTMIEPEFDMFHKSCTLRIIHYALGIPPSEPLSKISLVLFLKHSSLRS